MTVQEQAIFAEAPQISVDGTDIHEVWSDAMVSFSLEMQLQVPTRLTLRFVMPVLGQASGAPALPFDIGSSVGVMLPNVANQQSGGVEFVRPVGTLVVSECGVDYDGGATAELVVVAHDKSFHLTQSQHIRTFTKMTASDVVQAIASDGGLRAKVDPTREVHEYLFQADSDFAFVTTLARRYGFDWWVDGDELHFKEVPTSPTEIVVNIAEQLLRFSVSQAAVDHTKVRVSGWDRDQKRLIADTASGPTVPDREVPGTSNAYKGLGRSTTFQASGMNPASQEEARTIATALADGHVTASTEAQGEVIGDPAVVPGVVMKVEGEYVGGRYHVTSVDHRFTAAGYTTRFTAGDRVPNGLADLIGGSGGRDVGSFTGLPTMLPAVVTDIGKGEQLGRVKVTFPYLSEENTSHWARVLSAGGGPERGFWFLPEVDDEVLVGFEGGDPRFPVVMGGLYGKVNTPEDQLIKNGKINSRSLRSRLGHYMDFIDGTSATERSITMGLGSEGKAGTDYRLRIGEDRFDIEVPKGKPIAIKSGSSQITFTDSDSIEISAAKITVKAERELTLESGQKVAIKGGTEVAISQGGNKVTLGGSGLEAKGTPMATIKGGPLVKIG